ncbi:FUSC family protein [Streptomyces sp. JJ36]|uniref:FUSC family protein n=1 Tax=Streptomyces sp. JJ36 TaxID=2736645 RepID=UPI001F204C31|nr:FUSC family protein [Streptomyces sp. JJ36]MCF6523754.1 FUSC family protein [Streptomyces sp. JJ36]
MSWTRALRDTARSGLRIERTAHPPLMAVRGAGGVALIIGLTLWLGSPALAVSSAFGAFASGVATFQRSWRPRPVLALGAAGGLAVSTFLGYLCVPWPAAFLGLLALWSFGAGLAWAVGPTAGVVAGLTVAVMLVVVTLPTTVAGALVHAGLIAAGGLAQAALIVLLPVRPWGERRDALADALAGVADYARRLRHDPTAPFDPVPLMEARSAAAVTPRQARRRPRQLAGHRTRAERFRSVLASLADPVVGGAPEEGPERERVRELLGAAATVLDATARAVRRGERVRIPAAALAVLQVPESGPVLEGPAQKTAFRLIALVEDTVEAAQEPVEVTRPRPALLPLPASVRRPARTEEPPEHLHRPTVPRALPVALHSVRGALHRDSPVLRHAVRLALLVPLAQLLAWALPPEHGYWLPLSVVMVLRPDFSQTYARGVARAVGTLAGVVVAGGVLALTDPGPYAAAALAVVAVGLLYLLMSTGYLLMSACISAYVVFLLGIAGSPAGHTVPDRLLLTAFGAALAMLSHPLLPAWETPRLRDRLADWLEATGRYAVAVLDGFARPAQRHPRQVRDALLDLRSARSAWETAASRAGAEPVRHRGLPRRAARDAESALVTLGRATMLLEPHLPDRQARPSPGAAAFAGALRGVLPGAVRAVREGERPDTGPVHHALEAWRAQEAAWSPVALRAADLLTDALEELAAAVAPRR